MDSKPRPYSISAKLSSFSVCLSISLRREADVVDRSKVISRERASERRADLTELPLDQSLRVVIGAQVSSINRTPAVGEAISRGYRNVP